MPYLKKPSKATSRSLKAQERQDIYQSARWRKLREAQLMQQPLCEMCLEEGKVTQAEDVHHIDSFLSYSGTQRLYKAYDFSNLMSICKYHHGLIHNKQK